MTLEQAIEAIESKHSQIAQLSKEVRETKQQLIELTPFKKGQKVKVTHSWNGNTLETICFISWCEYDHSHKDKVKYSFSYMNKDGSRSSAPIYINDYGKIEPAP